MIALRAAICSRASGLIARSRYRARTLASGSVRPLRLSGSGCRHLPMIRHDFTKTDRVPLFD
ncbi:Uncharacterised protein [Mycobacteroides abscessus subsp. abscessus]|nr:Uncharacterised protein [Mycobacteroides abscessus subsp. abscessus]